MRGRERGRKRKRRRERQTGGREERKEGAARIDKDEISRRNNQVDRKTSFTNMCFLTFSFISKQS